MKKLLLCILGICVWTFLCGFAFEEGRNDPGDTAVYNNVGTYLLGDSRTAMGFADTHDPRANWYARCATDFACLNNEYAPILDEQPLKERKIVIMYGVNDVMRYGPDVAAASYLTFLQTKGLEWTEKGADVFFCSVPGLTPAIDIVMGPGYSAVTNINIAKFNTLMQTGLPKGIHYYQLPALKDTDYIDGLHYTEKESILLFEKVINSFGYK